MIQIVTAASSGQLEPPETAPIEMQQARKPMTRSVFPTPLQQACVARSLLSPTGGHYIQQLVCEWSQALHLDAWRQAWNFVAERQDALRMFFGWEPSKSLSLHFADRVDAPVKVVPATAAYPDREQALSDFLREDRRRGFDLAAAPLWRLTVFSWPDHGATTVWTFHHSLLDGRSHALVWQEVGRVYRSLLAGRPPLLPVARPFSEFPDWLAAHSEDASAASYWRERLRNFQPPTALPTLSLSPDSGDDDAPPAVETLALSGETLTQLRRAAQRFEVTLNNLVQGAWALALARYQGVDEVVFGAVRSGRHWTDVDPNERVGLFINTIPFHVPTSPSQPLGPWLQGLRAQQVAARAGEHASAEQIRRWCGLPRSAVLFRTVLMFEHRDPSASLSEEGQRIQLIEKTDLPSLVAYAGNSLLLCLDYSPRRHSARQIQVILRHVQILLEALATSPDDKRLGELSMISGEERRLTVEGWQGRVTAQPAPAIHRVLEAQAARTPEAPAVEFLDRCMNYAELHRQANCLARRLLQFCRPGERVMVVLERALEQPVVWLAALKAGVVYAPVDPANPGKRLDFLLDDLEPSILVTQKSLRPLLPVDDARVLCIDAPGELATLAKLEGTHLPGDPPRESPSSLLYTSGSTGLPKAAINSFAGLDNFAEYLRRTYDFGPADRVLQSSSTGFDGSLFDFVVALQSGATLVLVPQDQLRPGPGFTRMLETQRISTCLLTPTTLRSSPAPTPPVMRVLFAGGEPVTSDVLQSWSSGRRVLNVCGPTECSIWYQEEEVHPDGNRPTIGRFIQNCRGYVLDEDRQPVPIGVPGELYLGGVGVGLGYWKRDELNAEKYFPDPFAGKPEARMYRTGDRVRWLADGRIEPLGRLDFQVKIQGVRVELGEIESALRLHPAIADAVVTLHEGRLLAWFIPRHTAPSANALRPWLADHIAQIFIPAEFNAVSEFPRTINGKADRSALLSSRIEGRRQAEEPCSPAQNAERRRQLQAWNQTARPYPLERSAVELFTEQARRRPHATALIAGKLSLSYAALDQRARRLAQDLLRGGLQPEDIVALRFERSIGLVVSALAVLKAGGSYLPLDPRVPPTRQDFILSDSGARFALVAEELREDFKSWHGWIKSVPDSEPETANTNDPTVASNPRRRAYVIYTSGSTGKPKGVEIEHRSLTNLICFYQERLQLGPDDRATLLANPAFDASVADLWPVLCAGGTLLVPDPRPLEDPDALIGWLASEGATFTFVPTALGEIMFTRPWPPTLALRFLCVGGEALRARPPAGLTFSVLNTYGPTENTVDATWDIVLPHEEGPLSSPGIGRPIGNVRAYVLNDTLEPMPAGVEGELFLGGAQVARGYLNRPELTARKFLPDPFTQAPDARMYRTGDLVCWTADGRLEFRGRNDDQVKIRGQRVELGEIEATLRQHPGVREVSCRPLLDTNTAPGSKGCSTPSGIIAHVVMADASSEQTASELRQFLETRLPGYMIPAVFLSHPALPLTQQGKVDRFALDALAKERALRPEKGGQTPAQDSLVRALTELWCRIVPEGTNARGDQTFQELGGDSLGAVKLLLGVEEITGRRLALSTFLLEPTLTGLCRAVMAAEDESQKPILVFRRAGTRPPLFCVYDLSGDVGSYFDLARELGEDQPVFGIRSPALHHPARVPDSMETAARDVRKLLRAYCPSGRFGLVGFSWGGLLAFEVARQIAAEGGVSPFCGLFGTVAPPNRYSLAAKVAHAVRCLPAWALRLAQDRGHRYQRIRQAVISRRFLRNLLGEQPLPIPDWVHSPLELELLRLAHRYQPSNSAPVPVHLFREYGSFDTEAHPANFVLTGHLADAGWRHWAGRGLQVHWLDSRHELVLKQPHIKRTVDQFRSAMEQHFAQQDQRRKRGSVGPAERLGNRGVDDKPPFVS